MIPTRCAGGIISTLDQVVGLTGCREVCDALALMDLDDVPFRILRQSLKEVRTVIGDMAVLFNTFLISLGFLEKLNKVTGALALADNEELGFADLDLAEQPRTVVMFNNPRLCTDRFPLIPAVTTTFNTTFEPDGDDIDLFKGPGGDPFFQALCSSSKFAFQGTLYFPSDNFTIELPRMTALVGYEIGEEIEYFNKSAADRELPNNLGFYVEGDAIIAFARTAVALDGTLGCRVLTEATIESNDEATKISCPEALFYRDINVTGVLEAVISGKVNQDKIAEAWATELRSIDADVKVSILSSATLKDDASTLGGVARRALPTTPITRLSFEIRGINRGPELTIAFEDLSAYLRVQNTTRQNAALSTLSYIPPNITDATVLQSLTEAELSGFAASDFVFQTSASSSGILVQWSLGRSLIPTDTFMVRFRAVVPTSSTTLISDCVSQGVFELDDDDNSEESIFLTKFARAQKTVDIITSYLPVINLQGSALHTGSSLVIPPEAYDGADFLQIFVTHFEETGALRDTGVITVDTTNTDLIVSDLRRTFDSVGGALFDVAVRWSVLRPATLVGFQFTIKYSGGFGNGGLEQQPSLDEELKGVTDEVLSSEDTRDGLVENHLEELQLRAFTYYTVLVRPLGATGFNGRVQSISFKTTEGQPSAPTNISSTSATNGVRTFLVLEWLSPEFPAGALSHYNITVTDANDVILASYEADISNDETHITDMAAGVRTDEEFSIPIGTDVPGETPVKITVVAHPATSGISPSDPSATYEVVTPAAASAQSSTSSSSSTPLVAGIAGGGALLILLLLVLLVLYRRQQRQLKTPFRPPKLDKEWEYKRKNLVLGGKLGSGAFGTVLRGEATAGIREYKNKTVVAVKMCNGASAAVTGSGVSQNDTGGTVSESDRQAFLAEAELMKSISTYECHDRNVIRLLGVCTRKEPLLMIVEFMSNGDLKEYLRKARPTGQVPCSLELWELIRMCSDVAAGMVGRGLTGFPSPVAALLTQHHLVFSHPTAFLEQAQLYSPRLGGPQLPSWGGPHCQDCRLWPEVREGVPSDGMHTQHNTHNTHTHTHTHSLILFHCFTSFSQGVQPLLDAVVAYLPSPLDEPPVRLVGGERTASNPLLLAPEASEPLCALAFKVVHDAHRGDVTFMRVYSGSLRVRQTVVNTVRRTKERVTRLFEVYADSHKEIEEASAGSIVAVAGFKDTFTGDTLVSPQDKALARLRLQGTRGVRVGRRSLAASSPTSSHRH